MAVLFLLSNFRGWLFFSFFAVRLWWYALYQARGRRYCLSSNAKKDSTLQNKKYEHRGPCSPAQCYATSIIPTFQQLLDNCLHLVNFQLNLKFWKNNPFSTYFHINKNIHQYRQINTLVLCNWNNIVLANIYFCFLYRKRDIGINIDFNITVSVKNKEKH